MQQATERKINELNENRKRAINEQRSALKNQHSTEMASMKKHQDELVTERNNKIQQYQQMQNNLNQQIQQAHVQIQQLQNRPRKYGLYLTRFGFLFCYPDFLVEIWKQDLLMNQIYADFPEDRNYAWNPE